MKVGVLSLIVLVALLLSLCLTPLLRNVARKKNWMDIPRGRKHHKEPTPFVGGWVIFLVFWICFGLCYSLIPEIREELGLHLWAIFLAHLVVFIGGALDDFLDLRPFTKLLIQVLAATILFQFGLKIDTVYVPFTGSYLLGILSYPATVLWVVLIINALNIIDGMDGLAGGLSVMASVGLLYTSIMLHIPVVTAIAAVLIATLIGFLCFNFPRASVFMGDSGSQTIGFIFAVTAIYCPIKSYTVVAMFIPLLALGVPLVELGVTFIRRAVTGKSVVRADRGHLYHLMERRGIGKSQTVIIFWGLALVLQLFIFTLFLFDRRIVFSILVLFMLIVAGWFLLITRQEER